MTTLSLPSANPMSSGEMQVLDTARFEEVEKRHALVSEFIEHGSFDGVILRDPANIAWFTCGSRLDLRGTASPPAALFVSRDARVVLCASSESGQLFDREIGGLGFQLKERPWDEPRERLLRDLTRGRNVAADEPLLAGCVDVASELQTLRAVLSDRDASAMRLLGADLTHAVEATVRTFQRGESEAEVAGHVAHRMIKKLIEPVRIQVLADAQGHRFRHWGYGPDPIQRSLTLAVIGRRVGLHCAVARSMTFGPASTEMRNAHEVCSMVQASAIYFSQPGPTAEEVWPKLARIYEKYGAPDEWRVAEQAAVIGYSPEELPFTPSGGFRIQDGMAIHWHPSVRTALAGDTMIARKGRVEFMTPPQQWPTIPIEVKGVQIPRPAILVREDAGE